MAFNVDCVLKDHEVRYVEKKYNKKGEPYVLLRLESPKGKTCEVCTKEQTWFDSLLHLTKGEVYDWEVNAAAGREYSNLWLNELPLPVFENQAF